MIDAYSYIAGLVDGEGCITISKRPYKGGYQLVFRVAMYDKEPLDFIADTFGGSVNYPNRKDGKPIWCYTATGDLALEIMKTLQPYLLVKDKEAQVAITFQELKSDFRGGKHSHPTPEEIAFRESCYKDMQLLIKGHKQR